MVYFCSIYCSFADISVLFSLNPLLTLEFSLPVKVEITVQIKIIICPMNRTTYVATANIVWIVSLVYVSI